MMQQAVYEELTLMMLQKYTIHALCSIRFQSENPSKFIFVWCCFVKFDFGYEV